MGRVSRHHSASVWAILLHCFVEMFGNFSLVAYVVTTGLRGKMSRFWNYVKELVQARWKNNNAAALSSHLTPPPPNTCWHPWHLFNPRGTHQHFNCTSILDIDRQQSRSRTAGFGSAGGATSLSLECSTLSHPPPFLPRGVKHPCGWTISFYVRTKVTGLTVDTNGFLHYHCYY